MRDLLIKRFLAEKVHYFSKVDEINIKLNNEFPDLFGVAKSAKIKKKVIKNDKKLPLDFEIPSQKCENLLL